MLEAELSYAQVRPFGWDQPLQGGKTFQDLNQFVQLKQYSCFGAILFMLKCEQVLFAVKVFIVCRSGSYEKCWCMSVHCGTIDF